MTLDTLTVTSEKTPLDLLLWRQYKREVKGLVEDTLARNPGLAELGVYLPVGAQVTVAPPPPAGAPATPVITLYD